MMSHSLIVNLRAWTTNVLFRKFPPVLTSLSLFPTFCCFIFSVSVLCWGLWSVCVWVLCRVIIMDLFSILLHAYIQLDKYHLLKMLSFSHCMVLTTVQKIVHNFVCVYFCVVNFIPLINVSILYQFHIVFFTIAEE